MTQSGILVVDKPAGMTSHDVVARVRRVLQTRRVGHAGTLDPDATGVLVMCIGEACRLVEYLGADRKTYEATVVFGTSTDTDDAAGEVLATGSAGNLSATAVQEAAHRFLGVQLQRAPRVSAVHVAGRRAYERARAGEVFDVPVREIEILSLKVLSFAPGDPAETRFQVTCSKGTYIRSLCRDWGEALAVPAHLGTLRRVQSGAFSLDDAMPLEKWMNSTDPGAALLPMEVAVQALPALTLADDLCAKLAMGQSLTMDIPTWEGAGSRRARTGMERETVDVSTEQNCLRIAVFAASDGTLAAVADESRLPMSMRVTPKKVFWKKDK